MSTRKKRCPNGTRYNKKKGVCETQKNKRPKCPNGTRRNKQTRLCENKAELEAAAAKKAVAESLKRIDATLRIRRFFIKNKHKIRSLFLNAVCSDSGQCIALGTHEKKIRDFFGGFTRFLFLSNIKKIGADSANGLIYELEYTHQTYKSYAILKMNASPRTDSLLYEKFTGDRINTFSKYFPCFVETYGSYTLPKEVWTKIMARKSPLLTKKDLLSFEINPDDSYDRAESCRPSYYKTKALLIQHIKSQPGYSDIDDCLKHNSFVQIDLPFVLFQIYSVLGTLAYQFTHYDLHTKNVLMYEVKPMHVITCHYHYPDGTTVSFRSKYLPKIIDYGRSYVNPDDVKESPEDFRKSLCKIKNCNQPQKPCGRKYGYGWLNPAPNKTYIHSTKNNISHDLRLARIIRQILKKSGYDQSCLYEVLDRIVFSGAYGTIEKPVSENREGYIHNVKDMADALHHFIQLPNIMKIHLDKYELYDSLGDMHIHLDGSAPLRFVPR
jgi:hypothetical protein